jgi:hypothetical protein
MRLAGAPLLVRLSPGAPSRDYRRVTDTMPDVLGSYVPAS